MQILHQYLNQYCTTCISINIKPVNWINKLTLRSVSVFNWIYSINPREIDNKDQYLNQSGTINIKPVDWINPSICHFFNWTYSNPREIDNKL